MSAEVFNFIRLLPRDNAFLERNVGSSGQMFYNTDTQTLKVYDGKITGGYTVATQSNIRTVVSKQNVASITYNVTIGTDPDAVEVGNKYFLNGVYKPKLDFVQGYTYVFDQSDNTNLYFPNETGTIFNPHPIGFSADNPNGETDEGTTYLEGVIYELDGLEVTRERYLSGFNNAVTRIVRITITPNTPETIYYYCAYHLNMGNEIKSASPGSGSGASVTASSLAPEDPENGSVWFNSDTGKLYVYLVDEDSGQWVQPASPSISSLLDLGITDGTSGQLLSTNGSGTFTFIDAPSGGSSFDQTLNTTDDVAFASLNLSGALSVQSITDNGLGTSVIDSATTLTLSAQDGVRITGGGFRLPNLTTTQRNLLLAENGEMIYNTTDNKIQGYQNGAWINIEDGSSA